MPRLQHEVVAAGDRDALATRQHMVVGVAAARDPEGAFAGHQPSGLRGPPTLRIAHQSLFHDKLRVVPKNTRQSWVNRVVLSNEIRDSN
jgi:hypothetical protein